MSLRDELRRVLSVLVPLSITAFVYLYLYPIFHGCAFPASSSRPSDASPLAPPSGFIDTVREHLGRPSEPISHPNSAPFKLLVLADPQIEGDSSLPTPEYELGRRIVSHWGDITSANTTSDRLIAIQRSLTDIVVDDIPRSLRAAHKSLDLFGNDFYLAHIYRALRWWTRPTHVTVLGDLIGSQWVSDGEFEARSRRYWDRVFDGGVRVDDNITVTGSENYEKKGKPELQQLKDASWSNRIINIAGNHDVGYAGDITEDRIGRFDREFGRANWDVRFDHSTTNSNDAVVTDGANPSLHIVVLNSLPFDVPALTPSVQSHTYSFLSDVITHRSYPVEDRTSFTLLLTHLPLHKQEGVCTDAPNFVFHEEEDDDYPEGETPRFKAGGIQEQNHLSDYMSHTGILQGIFGMSGDRSVPAGGQGRNGLILTGHDHTGCDVVHFVDRNETQKVEEGSADDKPDWSWNARRYSRSSASSDPNNDSPSVREVTLRSMMGEFGGNAGLLSLWFDSDPSVREWKYEITMCPLGAQHGWWAVHAVGIATIVMFLVWISLPLLPHHGAARGKATRSAPSRKDNKRSIKKSDKAEARSPKSRNGKFDSKRSQRGGNSQRRN